MPGKPEQRPSPNEFKAQDTILGSIIGYTMKRAFMTMYDDYQANIDKIGFRQKYFSALSLIVDNPDMSQSDLARALSVERPAVVVIVDTLEDQELITRNRVPGDRRTYALRATLKGRRQRDRALKAIHEHEDALLKDLSDEERKTLLALLRRIVPHGKDNETKK